MRFFFVLCSFVVVSLALDTCSEADKKYVFTPCNPLTQMRSAVTYWTRPCNTTDAATQLSVPQQSACNLECPSGRYYSAKTLDCAMCPAGQYSSTGEAYTSFATWPTNFVTYCSPSPCEAWQVNSLGTYLQSGNQSIGQRANGDDTVVSSLSYIVRIQQSRGGSVTFTYLVESEEFFDGLSFYLNGTRQTFQANTNFLATGLQRSWVTKSVPLPYGTSEVRWTYEKDSDQFSPTGAASGMDRAWLRDIIFDGTKLYSTRCSVCPAGYSSTQGSSACTQCPQNTYATEGSGVCSPCADGFYSGPGSSECVKRAPCDPKVDYVPVFSKCDSTTNSRSKSFQLMNPYCLVDNTTIPAQQDSLMCAQCLPGYVMDKKVCKACPGGQYSPGPGTSCQPCKEGSAAVPNLDYRDFDFVGDIGPGDMFTTQCVGVCRGCNGYCTTTNAWEPFPFVEPGTNTPVVGLSSGKGLGPHADSVLTIVSTLVNPGSIKFQYFFFRRSSPFKSDVPDDISGSFFIDDQIEYKLSLDCFGAEKMCSFDISLPEIRTYKFTWVFSKNFVFDTTSPITLVLRSLSVLGDSRGSATACQDCLPGYTCPQGNAMTPCPAGYIANMTGSTVCEPCRGETVADQPGMSACVPCAKGSHANADHTQCVVDCVFEDGAFTYDLSRLKGKNFGPITLEGTHFTTDSDFDAKNQFRFYFGICQPLAFNNTFAPCPASGNPFSCQRITSSRTTNLGTDMSYASQGYDGLQVIFSGGERCGALGSPRQTVITLECDPDRSNIDGKVRFISEKPTCTYNFLLKIRDACPACTRSSYQSSAGPCHNNGSQQLTYYRIPEAEGCYGGFPLPSPTWANCNRCTPDMYEFLWSSCVDSVQQKVYQLSGNYTKSTCVQTPDSFPPPESRACAILEAKAGANPFTIIVSIILVITILVGIYMFYASHHKKKLMGQIEKLEEMDTTGGAGGDAITVSAGGAPQPAPKSPGAKKAEE